MLNINSQISFYFSFLTITISFFINPEKYWKLFSTRKTQNEMKNFVIFHHIKTKSITVSCFGRMWICLYFAFGVQWLSFVISQFFLIWLYYLLLLLWGKINQAISKFYMKLFHIFLLCCSIFLFLLLLLLWIMLCYAKFGRAGEQRKWLFSFKVIKESQKGTFPSNFPLFVPSQFDRKRNTDEAEDFPVEKFSTFFWNIH
jgi:hypothetical protein